MQNAQAQLDAEDDMLDSALADVAEADNNNAAGSTDLDQVLDNEISSQQGNKKGFKIFSVVHIVRYNFLTY